LTKTGEGGWYTRGESNVTTGTGIPKKNPIDMSAAKVGFGSITTAAPSINVTKIVLRVFIISLPPYLV
jgi:hypothetical protein